MNVLITLCHQRLVCVCRLKSCRVRIRDSSLGYVAVSDYMARPIPVYIQKKNTLFRCIHTHTHLWHSCSNQASKRKERQRHRWATLKNHIMVARFNYALNYSHWATLCAVYVYKQSYCLPEAAHSNCKRVSHRRHTSITLTLTRILLNGNVLAVRYTLGRNSTFFSFYTHARNAP